MISMPLVAQLFVCCLSEALALLHRASHDLLTLSSASALFNPALPENQIAG
jgi:hypothetical protein